MKKGTPSIDDEKNPSARALEQVRNNELPHTIDFACGLMSELRRKFQETFPHFIFDEGKGDAFRMRLQEGEMIRMPGDRVLFIKNETTDNLKGRRIVVYHEGKPIASIPNKDPKTTDKIVSKIIESYKKVMASSSRQFITRS